MKKEFIEAWLKTGIIRNRQRDAEKIKSMIDSAEINSKVTRAINLNEDTATLIFREIYESVRQLGDAQWWLLGYEPLNHEASLEILKEMKIKENLWDGKWRTVIFDIPEKLKSARNALRDKLKEVGFHELQKSVFVFPYECKDEIDFIIEFFNLRQYVRYGIFDFIDNDLHLRKTFNLTLNKM